MEVTVPCFINNQNFIIVLYYNKYYKGFGWSLLSPYKVCNGGIETFKGRFETVEGCAEACKGMTLWFIFATSKKGNDKCSEKCCDMGCKCYCESGTGDPAACELASSDGYHLYSFLSTGNIQNYS